MEGGQATLSPARRSSLFFNVSTLCRTTRVECPPTPGLPQGPSRGAKQPYTRGTGMRRTSQQDTASAASPTRLPFPRSPHSRSHHAARHPVHPSRRGGPSHQWAARPGWVTLESGEHPCPSYEWYRSVQCRRSLRRNAVQDLTTGINSDASP